MTALRQSVATFAHGAPLKVSFLALVYLDLLLTLFAVQHGFTEMNPFMIRLLDRPWELFLMKGMAPLFIAWLLPGKWLLPSAGFMAGVAFWNISQLLTLL